MHRRMAGKFCGSIRFAPFQLETHSVYSVSVSDSKRGSEASLVNDQPVGHAAVGHTGSGSTPGREGSPDHNIGETLAAPIFPVSDVPPSQSAFLSYDTDTAATLMSLRVRLMLALAVAVAGLAAVVVAILGAFHLPLPIAAPVASAIALVAGGLVAWVLIGRSTAPLRAITQFVREIAAGNFHPQTRLQPSRSHEIASLNTAVLGAADRLAQHLNHVEDARARVERSEQRLRNLVDEMRDVLFELDPDGFLRFLNPAWTQLTGIPVAEALGRPLAEFIQDRRFVARLAPDVLPKLYLCGAEVQFASTSGKRVWAKLDAHAQTDARGRFTGVSGTIEDVTERVELGKRLSKYQDDLYHLSITDPLTGLYNRRHFDIELDNIVAEEIGRREPVCLLLVDLDRFKFINDTYGHPAGDQALRAIADLLRKLVRRGDYTARIAGNEFAMVLRGVGIEETRAISEKLHAAIHATWIDLPVGRFQLASSMGVACAPTHGKNAQELVAAADVALYQSKRAGRNRVQVLSPDTSRAVMTIFSQGFRLRDALASGRLIPAFQPILDIETGKPIAYEALARMISGEDTVHAADFIAAAEELGLTRELDLYMIEQSLKLAPEGYGLFLNIDPSSFSEPAFAKQLADLIGPACRAGRAVTIEITEREAVAITDTLLTDIADLRALGCKLALDDFGSGYSTYHFLNLFRPEYLKIEGVFVRGMLRNDANRKIVAHIHDLAASFGCQTIAECVEDEPTRAALLSMGIRHAQGFHLGRPMFAT